MAIPAFFDEYHLPNGEHICSLTEIEKRFATNASRNKVWILFLNLLSRLETIGVRPRIVLIDGSFVTGRNQPGDVDFCALIKDTDIKKARPKLDFPDRFALKSILDSGLQPDTGGYFGVDLCVVPDKAGLDLRSKYYRTSFRDLEPERDPDWVRKPNAKGMAKVYIVKKRNGMISNDARGKSLRREGILKRGKRISRRNAQKIRR